MAKLYLQRHLKSQWNLDNRYAGWCDNPLSKEGSDMAKTAADNMQGQHFDCVYTSPLMRNKQTVVKVLRNFESRYPLFIHLDGGRMQKWGNFDKIDVSSLPVYVSEKLNERYYGDWQGLNKEEIIQKYGAERVKQLKRSYNEAPPGGESGKDVCKRVIPFFEKYIMKDLQDGKNVLVVASHNSLRAIIKYIENISDEKFGDLELTFGALAKYDFDGKNYTKLQ